MMCLCVMKVIEYRKRCRKTSLLVYMVNELEMESMRWFFRTCASYYIASFTVTQLGEGLYEQRMMMYKLSTHNTMPIFRCYSVVYVGWKWPHTAYNSIRFSNSLKQCRVLCG